MTINEFKTNDWRLTTFNGKRAFVAVLLWVDVPPAEIREIIGEQVKINGIPHEVLAIEIVDGQVGLVVLR